MRVQTLPLSLYWSLGNNSMAKLACDFPLLTKLAHIFSEKTNNMEGKRKERQP